MSFRITSPFERLHGIPLGRRGSQNSEEAFVFAYFNERGRTRGRFLDIGAMDGVTISNTYALAVAGWAGACVEPDPHALEALRRTHEGNPDIEIVAAAISETDGVAKFHSSRGGGVSTLSDAHRRKWSATQAAFETIVVPTMTAATLLRVIRPGPYAFLSLDVEGRNADTLEMFPLREIGVELACVEYDDQLDRIMDYCASEGLTRAVYQSGENILMGRA